MILLHLRVGSTRDEENSLLAEIFKTGFPSCQVDQGQGELPLLLLDGKIPATFIPLSPQRARVCQESGRLDTMMLEQVCIVFCSPVLNSHVSFHVSP